MKTKLSLATLFGLAASPALAHHPLAGAPMETFTHGILSGIGHPVLGFDHLFFVIAVGLAAVYAGRAKTAPLAYIGAMLVGCLLTSFGTHLPLKEAVIALSLLALGGLVLSGRAKNLGVCLALFAGFGLFHGSAFGDSIAAQEAGIGGTVLIGYLIGLAAVQYAIAVAAGASAIMLWKSSTAHSLEPRLAGAVVAGIGLFLSLETIEGAAFAALGIG